ncbi:TraB/GumN family protein [Brevundimonas sp. NIBR11]|uniref:TraB/GumN family protein n=1 Tax=Brevundimonas sp. NIBR11 TaxID=3015999 RepID=UPI0022F1412A|nr:TraB/GumN family protein [Brevundimonas sp. NIBR11]WGM29927.1 hypothetical protein KKHFBJBL_00141 [Brevundimonas sp. NIBR11]
MRTWLTGLALITALAGTTPVWAQETQEDRVEDIVVTARRAGAPMWTVERGSSTVILVGAIRGVPEGTPWDPAALEAATARSQHVMAGTGVRGSVSDLFRVIWRMRSLTSLPNGTTSADYLEPEWQARLDAIEARTGKDYSRRSFLLAPGDLLRDAAGFGEDTTDDPTAVVRRAARSARTPVRPVEPETRGNQLIEDLLNAPPATRLVCMHAAIQAAEAGPEAVLARGRAWTRLQVAEVMASPIQQALEQCWPWGDPALGPPMRAAWVGAIDTALSEPGVAMAVAPLGLLAEPGGVLDQLEADGLDVRGPDWKAEN